MKKTLSKLTAIATISSTLFCIPFAHASGEPPKPSLPTFLSHTQSTLDYLSTFVKAIGDSMEKKLFAEAMNPNQSPIIISEMSTKFEDCQASLIAKGWSVLPCAEEPRTLVEWEKQHQAYNAIMGSTSLCNFNHYLMKRQLFDKRKTPKNFTEIKKILENQCKALQELCPNYQCGTILGVLTEYSKRPSPLFHDFKEYLEKIAGKQLDDFCIMHNSDYSRVCILIEFEGQLTLLAY